jgi:choline dehydrogenase-like flavoprotein
VNGKDALAPVSGLADVAIIGSGPSGAIAALGFARAGFSVVCIEQGDYPDYTLVKPAEADYELIRGRYFGASPNRRMGAADYPIDTSQSEIEPLMWNGVGGGSIIYAAAWNRFRPQDFRHGSITGVGDDWPLEYRDLAPYYARAEREFFVSGVGGDPRYPDGFDLPMPPIAFGSLERRIALAHNRLGWHWWPGSNAIASAPTGSLSPCVRRGSCMTGCFDGAKASVDRTHWPRALSAGVRLITRSRVLRVETDKQGRVTGVVCFDRSSGRETFVAAEVVVLAANGIGTPRLLLASSNSTHPNGLGNSSGLVGTRLMMHPMSTVEGIFEDRFDSWQGPSGQRLYSLEFADANQQANLVRGAKWQLMGSGGPLETARSMYWRGHAVWGAGFHEAFTKRFGHSASWTILAEDLADENNRVTLDSSLPSPEAGALARVSYQIAQEVKHILAFNEDMAAESLREAGAYEVVKTTTPRETGWHLLGTAVMGTDRASSVVDSFGRSHDVENLFVFDGSVFPTSGPVNPTATIAALALRAVESAIRNARFQALPRRSRLL